MGTKIFHQISMFIKWNYYRNHYNSPIAELAAEERIAAALEYNNLLNTPM